MASTTQDVFAKVRGHERAEQLRAAREADLLPYFRTLEGPAGPGRRDGGRRADHARLEQLPRPDRRRARHPGRRSDALHTLRHRAHRLAAAQRHDLAAPRARARDRRVDGHRGGARLLDGRAGEPHRARDAARRPATPSSSTPATTPRSWTAASSAARSCARFATTSSTSSSARSARRRWTAAASSSSSTASSRWRATSRRCREIADLCERFGARLMVDEAHGAGVLGARGAGASELLGVEDRVDLRMGTFSKSLASCGGFLAGHARGHRLPARPEPRVPLHGRRRARGARRGARGGADRPLRRGPAAAGARARQRRLPARRACASAAFRSSSTRATR